MISLEQGEYRISEGKIWITMSVDFKNRTFTLQTKGGKCDFTFLDSKPEVALVVLRLMQEAAELAVKVLDNHIASQIGLEEPHGLD